MERNPDGFPIGICSPTDIRLLARWLEEAYPLADLLPVIESQRYTLAHEIAGTHGAIAELRTLADNLEEAQGDKEESE